MNNISPPPRPEPVRLSDQYQQIQAEAFRLVLDRLERRGIPGEAIHRITCPIGVAGIAGKEPEVIAVAVVAQLLQRCSAAAAAPARRPVPETA